MRELEQVEVGAANTCSTGEEGSVQGEKEDLLLSIIASDDPRGSSSGYCSCYHLLPYQPESIFTL